MGWIYLSLLLKMRSEFISSYQTCKLNCVDMRLFASRLQNAYYNRWTCSHYCSNILTFAPDGTIIHAILNAPGSWHDSNIAKRLYQMLMTNTPVGYQIISNTAFPRCTNCLDYRIMAPMKRGDWVPDNPREFAQLKKRNTQLVSARQAAEWGMRAIQGSFSCLKLLMPALDHKFCPEVIELAVWLHQLRCQSVGINQTARVYQEVEDDFSLLSQSFHNMLFPEIQKQCQISRYYNNWFWIHFWVTLFLFLVVTSSLLSWATNHCYLIDLSNKQRWFKWPWTSQTTK